MTSSGKHFEDSGAMEYDPISMRMVPKSALAQKDHDQVATEDSRRKTATDRHGARPFEDPKLKSDAPPEEPESDPENSEFEQRVRAKEQEYLAAKKRLQSPDHTTVEYGRPEVSQAETRMPASEPRVSTWSTSYGDQSCRASPQGKSQEAKEAYSRFRNNSAPTSRRVPVRREFFEEFSTPEPKQHISAGTRASSPASSKMEPSDSPRAKAKLDWLKAKQDMERSWARAKPSQDRHVTSSKDISAVSRQKVEAAAAWKRFKNTPERQYRSVDEEELRREHEHEARAESKGVYRHPLYEMTTALKSMSAKELKDHKARLCKLWNKSQRVPKAASPADKKLQDEIESQKLAMQAFENRKFDRGSSVKSASQNEPVDGKNEKVELLAGEGDMSANVAKFVDKSKWYKQPVPGAKEQRLRDRELVRNVQQIYEENYGPIDAKHRQGSPKTDDGKMAQANAMFEQLREADDANFAKFINTNKIAPTLPKKTDTSSSEKLSQSIDSLPERPQTSTGQTQHTDGSRPSPSAPVNPVDGTTLHQVPDLTPQTGNFASPTGFVNHDVPISEPLASSPRVSTAAEEPNKDSVTSDSARSCKSERVVRKEEPVFSGSLPLQRYTIPEIVDLLNRKGLINATRDSFSTIALQLERAVNQTSASSNNSGGSSRGGNRNGHEPSNSGKRRSSYQEAFEKGQRHHRRTLIRKLLKVSGLSFGVVCFAYWVGVATEQRREAEATRRCDDEAEGWNTARWMPQRRANVEPENPGKERRRGMFWSTTERREAERKSEVKKDGRLTSAVSEMPLKGFEFPIVGMLAWSVWFLIMHRGS